MPVEEPDRPLGYGGRIQILGVELYSDKIAVNWRLAPLPDPESLFAAELAEQEPDLEGLADDFKSVLRDKLIQQLQMRRRSITLADDVGTQYRGTGGGSGGGGNERRGHSDFAPGLPAEAQRLIVRWDQMEFRRCPCTAIGLHPDCPSPSAWGAQSVQFGFAQREEPSCGPDLFAGNVIRIPFGTNGCLRPIDSTCHCGT